MCAAWLHHGRTFSLHKIPYFRRFNKKLYKDLRLVLEKGLGAWVAGAGQPGCGALASPRFGGVWGGVAFQSLGCPAPTAPRYEVVVFVDEAVYFCCSVPDELPIWLSPAKLNVVLFS